MFVVGFGTALPWGLMDGLSVSVVPTERSGMASGIFNTSKVANEGIALAVVTALGFLTALFIGKSVHVPFDQIGRLSEAAQSIVAGDIKAALKVMPGLSRATLTQGYVDAFRNVTRCLAALTAIAALVVLDLLGKKAKTSFPTYSDSASSVDV